MTLAQINKKIRAEVSEHITLTRDEGYHTLTYDDGDTFNEYTVYTPYTSDLLPSDWVEEARFAMIPILS